MEGTGKKVWGYYPGPPSAWIPLQVDDEGKVIVDMSAVNLDDIGDIFAAGAVEGDMLYFDATSGTWMLARQANLANILAALTNLNDLADVAVIAPSDGEALIWDDVTSSWVPQAVAAGVGKTYFTLDAPVCMWKSAGVSSTPRQATIQGIAGDVITLTANEAYRFGVWGASPDNMNVANVILRIINTDRAEYAWMKARPAANQLQVTAAGAIAGWLNGEIIETDTTTKMQLDISSLIPAGVTAIYAKVKVKDTAAVQSGCYLYKNMPATVAQNTTTQALNVYIYSFMIALIDSTNRHIAVREVAGGVDTLTSVVNVLGYFI